MTHKDVLMTKYSDTERQEQLLELFVEALLDAQPRLSRAPQPDWDLILRSSMRTRKADRTRPALALV